LYDSIHSIFATVKFHSDNTMALPKKITPDNIKEAVIELRYVSELPFELLLGLFFNEFDDSYVYTNRPIKTPILPGLTGKQNKELFTNIASQSILYNPKISIQVLPNAFVFSCLNQYIGWNDFMPEVEKAIKIISDSKKVIKWIRIGLRYITEYRNKDLKECIKFNFSFGLPHIQSTSTAFKSEFDYKDSKVILNLNNKMPALAQKADNKQPEIIPISIIDIDIIKEPLEITNMEDLLKVIEDAHTKEKELFFGMLTDEFLKSLNPEY